MEESNAEQPTQLVEKRWTRYGHDRVYVSNADNEQVGYVDLKTGDVVVTDPAFRPQLEACRDRWVTSAVTDTAEHSESEVAAQTETPRAAPGEPLPPPQVPLPTPSDLAKNYAGAAARAKRDEVNAAAPVRNLLARVIGVRTAETGWREGAIGEQKVGRELAKLGEGWHRMHAVPVGNRGSDIDHVVIGPPGVFTLNAKRHDQGNAMVYEKSIYVNGQKVPYLRNARFEAERASILLSAACGFDVPVRPVIVFVDLADFTVKQQPPDVHVINRRALLKYLRELPPILDPRAVEVIWANARWDTTWQPPATTPKRADQRSAS